MEHQLEIMFQHDEPLYVQPSWSNEDVEVLRAIILEKSLASLKSKKESHRERQDAIEWLMEDVIYPFSYRVCCESMQLDPDKLRDDLIDYLKKQ